MGSTLALPESFRMTIGIFVIGSIINPRIFISTSIASLQHNTRMSKPGFLCGRLYTGEHAARPRKNTHAEVRDANVGGQRLVTTNVGRCIVERAAVVLAKSARP